MAELVDAPDSKSGSFGVSVRVRPPVPMWAVSLIPNVKGLSAVLYGFNIGPDAVTGALVTDTGVEGLTWTATDAVTITGDGVPAGSFAIVDLTWAGIALDTLADGGHDAQLFLSGRLILINASEKPHLS